MSKQDFFSTTDKEREAETQDFIQHMKRPREQVEAPEITIPGLDEDIPEEDHPTPPAEDALHLEYNKEQLWSAELILYKTDEVIAWLLAVFTDQNPDKYRKRKQPAAKDDREVQLLAALINKYQMRMSLEAAFLSLFVMGYPPVFVSAYQDFQQKKRRKKPAEPVNPAKEAKE